MPPPGRKVSKVEGCNAYAKLSWFGTLREGIEQREAFADWASCIGIRLLRYSPPRLGLAMKGSYPYWGFGGRLTGLRLFLAGCLLDTRCPVGDTQGLQRAFRRPLTRSTPREGRPLVMKLKA